MTGSKYLVSAAGKLILVDCGLFQGLKEYRLRNRADFPVSPSEIDAVILTHAHLDHSGYIPLLIKRGFRGKIFCTSATRDLCSILLPDSGFLQEEEASYAKKHGYSKHDNPLPLYTQRDAEIALSHFEVVDWDKSVSLWPSIEFSLHYAGHILGAAHAMLGVGGRRLLFSGDLGRPDDPLMLAPTTFEMTDYLVVESTYGDRTHPTVDPMIELREIISKTVDRGGVVLIPAFAVGRVQLLLYYLWRLRTSKAIPNIPIYLNSPMATDTNTIFLRHHNEHRLSEVEAQAVCNIARCITSAHESMDLNSRREPMVIIAASGMATGGRILHHLKAFGGDSKNTILFVGHQAEGTRGRNIVDGQKQVKIHGQYWPIRAEVRQIHTLSAHADSEEVLSWLSLFKRPPRLTFLTHGEPQASLSLMKAIDERLRWTCAIPKYDQEFSLN